MPTIISPITTSLNIERKEATCLRESKKVELNVCECLILQTELAPDACDQLVAALDWTGRVFHANDTMGRGGARL